MIDVSLRHQLGEFALDVAFDAPDGVTALFGRSGAGKTSIVKAIAGLIRPDAGRIVVAGEVLFDSAAGINVPVHKRRIGYVFQDARLFPHLSVAQNLDYGARFQPGPGRADRDGIIGMLGLDALLTRRPASLSGGEASRVALGRAILTRPRLLLLDEPLSALDEDRKADIMPYLERLRDEAGLPMIYVSHAMSEVARLANTLVLIGKGQVLRAGPLAALLADPGVAPLVGLREAGAVVQARVSGEVADGLSRIDTSAGALWLPTPDSGAGSTLRLRILAQDVTLAIQRPDGISALNILPAVVQSVRMGDGPGALVQLRVGEETILSRITRRSAAALDLSPGRAVFAILKAVSVAPENLG